MADQVLQGAGKVSVFFNICDFGGSTAAIEDLGDAFGTFLTGLRFTDGEPVDQVDVVAYSMGGLVLRSYLSGKRRAPRTFLPPPATHVRKAVFLATPHFGSGVPLSLPFSNDVLDELASGSEFQFDLATWNQAADDLNGVDAITAIGNGGTGRATTKGFDDGLIALTSGSLGFYRPGRTRVIPFCHSDGSGLLGASGLCSSGAKGIAQIDSAMHDSARIIISFLNGTNEWQTVGTAAEQDPLLSVNGGLSVMMRDANDGLLAPGGVGAMNASQTKALNTTSRLAYTDMFAAGLTTLTGASGAISASAQITLAPAVYQTVVLKPGPAISGVAPSAAAVFPLGVAPGQIISIYGTGLDGAQVTMGGTMLQILSASSTLINAVVPDSASGFTNLTVQNGSGVTTVNLAIQTAVPAVFTVDRSGHGPAAAVDATTGIAIDGSHPARAGDSIELFLTGLGATTRSAGLDVANQQPAVTIGGRNCPVTFAGRAPGFTGLDQINCIVPIGTSGTEELVVISGDRVSNSTTVIIQ